MSSHSIATHRLTEHLDLDAISSYSADSVERYCSDESRVSGSAERVFVPKTEAELVTVVAEANARNICVTVRGAGTGVVAGAIPRGGWVVSTEKLSAIGVVDKRSDGFATITVQPGVRVAEIVEVAAEAGMFYPPNPTESNASIGGNINTDASGSRAYKYGPTRGYVEALRIVLMNGDLLSLKRGEVFFDDSGTVQIQLSNNQTVSLTLPTYSVPDVKSSAGYFVRPNMDLIDLFIGSEGTLGVISEAVIRLIDEPNPVLSGLVYFDSLDEALTFIESIREATLRNSQTNSAGLQARAIEFIGESALHYVRSRYQSVLPKNTNCAVLIEQEIADASGSDAFDELPAVRELFALLGERADDPDATWISLPGDQRHMKRILEFRHAIPEEVNKHLTYEKMGTDLIAPYDALREFVDICSSIPQEFKVPHAIWGHISKSQLHVNLIPTTDEERERALQAYAALAEAVVRLGGSVAAEHGIGKTKHPYLRTMFGDAAIQQMRALKGVLDPKFLLGRDTIFPSD